MLTPPRLAFVVCLSLAVLHTWPIGGAPASRSLNQNADAQQWAWTLSWIAHILPRNPLHLFDGNVFAPEPRILAYSDPVVVPALLGAPVRWIGGSPVLTFNLTLIAGLALTAWAGWFVAWKWTGSMGAALVAGALTAFNAHLLTRLPHVQAAHSWGLPLAWYFADRLMDRPARADVWRLALVVAATAATSVYSLTFAALIIAVVAIAGLWRGRSVAAIAVALALGLVAALPVLWPYVLLARTGATRPLSAVAQFSATPAGYLTSLSHLHSGWSSGFFRDEVNVLFAGVTAILLAAVGIVVAIRQPTHRRRAATVVLIAAAGVVLSFGPRTSVYVSLYEWILPLRALRAAARFGYLYLLAIALAAAFGVAWLERRLKSPRSRRILAAVALTAVTIEAWSGPIPTQPFTRVPPIYERLRELPAPIMLVEVPFYPPDAVFENGEYMLNATAHWQPVMNGYSGAMPDAYRRRADSFWFFPRDWAIDAIRKENATHVMVHLERFSEAEREDIRQALVTRADLKLVASDALGHRLYRLDER